MTGKMFQMVEAHGAGTDLSSRAKFRLTGTDRVRYLNGQVTHDVRKLAEGASLYACVTNAKGRVEGDVYIHIPAEGGALLLDAEEGLRERLMARLDRYIVADDVELTDVTEEWRLWHFFGDAAGRVRDMPPQAGTHLVESTRCGVPGIDLWLPAGPITFAPPGEVTILDPDGWETFRVLQRTPRWPHEIHDGIFPQEAGLEGRAMSFTKGCYIGQEILSRIKLTGKMPLRLVALSAEVPDGGLPEPLGAAGGWRLFDGATDPPKEVGPVTSLARHPALDQLFGLAYVKQAWTAGDSLLLGGEEPPKIFAKVDICSS